MNQIEGVILDWAGTTVDFGCFAPVYVFLDIFKAAGIEVTMEEARVPMGMLKRDHIKAMLNMPRINRRWEETYGRAFNEDDINCLYSNFEPLLMQSLDKYTAPIPFVVDTVNTLKRSGLKIGSTTGYTDSMMAVVTKGAKEHGYSPDCWVSPDSTNSLGRPYPYMIFKNLEELKITAPWKTVKVGDTISDIQEGIFAGVWSVGVVIGSSQMGLSLQQYNSLSQENQTSLIEKTKNSFFSAGADFVIETLDELLMLIEKINQLLAQGKRPTGGIK